MKLRHTTILATLLCATGIAAHGQTFTWLPTGGNQDWNLPANWDPSTVFPDAAGVIASLNNDITAATTVRLQEDIIIGTLNLGDATASVGNFPFTIANEGAETFVLTFDSGATGTPARINTSGSGTPTNSLNVPIALSSDLAVNIGGFDASNRPALSLGGITALNGHTVTFTGGIAGQNQIQFAATSDFTGSGTIVNNSNTSIVVTGTKAFAGTIVLNKGVGGSNTGSLTVTTGSIAAVAEVIINGFLSGNGIVQNGGSLHAGDNSARATPSQRLTQNRITLNGGSLSAGGQNLVAPSTDIVSDTVAALDINSGYSLISVNGNAASGGTRLNITSLERSVGASAFLRSTTLAGTARMMVANINPFLVGGGGPESSTTMSLLPWMVAANTNGSAGSAASFATNTATGLRALLAGEYTNLIQAGPDVNYNAGNVTIANPDASATVNSVVLTVGAATNMGVGKTLIVKSGGVIIQNGGGGIGVSGNAAAGTLQFGLTGVPVEGVVWANGTNTNSIGAAISGSGGLSKAGTGTLILTGDNLYTGLTYVGGGTLQVGDGTNTSNLGLEGDVSVANGALLSLFNDSAIADSAALRLEQFGLFTGRVSLATGINETVASIYFGNDIGAAGTYGSSASAALFKNDTYFSGSGIITVVPEPGSAALLLGGLGMLMGRRRRR